MEYFDGLCSAQTVKGVCKALVHQPGLCRRLCCLLLTDQRCFLALSELCFLRDVPQDWCVGDKFPLKSWSRDRDAQIQE